MLSNHEITIPMKRNSLIIFLAAVLMSAMAYSQDAQPIYPRAKNLNDDIQKDLLYTEYVMSNGKGWSSLSEEKKGVILRLVDDFSTLKTVNAQPANTNDVENKKDNEAQLLAIRMAKSIRDVYLKQSLSAISTDYLNALKQILTNYKGEKDVKECIKDVDSMIVWVRLYNNMDNSLNQPFNKPQVTKVLIDASKSFNGLKAKNKKQYDEFVDKYWQLYYYEASIKLFQNLIKTVNNDSKMKTYRTPGEDYVFEALVRYVNIWKGMNNKKYEGKDKDVFKSFLFNNPYLKDLYQEYHMGMIANPTQQNTFLESRILQIKTN